MPTVKPIGEAHPLPRPHTGWYVRVTRYASGRKLPQPRILLNLDGSPFSSGHTAMAALQAWKDDPRSCRSLKPDDLLPVVQPVTVHKAVITVRAESSADDLDVSERARRRMAAAKRRRAAAKPEAACAPQPPKPVTVRSSDAVTERNWAADLVFVRWNREDRLAIKLGRVRNGRVRIAMVSKSGYLSQDSVLAGATRKADLLRVKRPELERTLQAMVDQKLLRKCDRRATLLAYDREWRESEKHVVRWNEMRRVSYRAPKHAGPLPGHLIEVASLATLAEAR